MLLDTTSPLAVNTATFAVPPIVMLALPFVAVVMLVLPLMSATPGPAATFDN